MPDEDIMGELEELSEIVESEEDIEKGLQEIEEMTKGVSGGTSKKEESKQEKSQYRKADKKETTKKANGAGAKKEEVTKKNNKEQKEEAIKKEKKPQPKPAVAPERAIKHTNGFKIASALLIIIGFAVYVVAYYLRWNGWHLISYPPSSVVALGGTLLILAGGEVYYRGKER